MAKLSLNGHYLLHFSLFLPLSSLRSRHRPAPNLTLFVQPSMAKSSPPKLLLICGWLLAVSPAAGRAPLVSLGPAQGPNLLGLDSRIRIHTWSCGFFCAGLVHANPRLFAGYRQVPPGGFPEKAPLPTAPTRSELLPPVIDPTARRSRPGTARSTAGGLSPTTESQLAGSANPDTAGSGSSGTLVAAGFSAPPPPTTTTPTPPMPSDSSQQSAASTTGSSADGNRTLVIALTVVFAGLGVVLIAGLAVWYHRYRRKRVPLFDRGITPVDDEEIESWKISPEERAEKHVPSVATKTSLTITVPRSSESNARSLRPSTTGRDGPAAKAASDPLPPTTPIKRSPSSVIVYQHQGSSSSPAIPGYRRSEELSPGSTASSCGLAGSRYGRASMDRDVPQTPILARAPNAREGLTDQSIPGDEPYIPLPKRQPSRLSKNSPQITSPRLAHTRTRSSRSSLRSFGLGWDHPHSPQQQHPQSPQCGQGPYGYYGGGSEQELPRAGRASSDYPRSSGGAGLAGYSPPHHRSNNYPHYHRHHHQYSGASSHSRVYSTSSIPPSLSFSDDVFGSPKPLLREDIGRAIG